MKHKFDDYAGRPFSDFGGNDEVMQAKRVQLMFGDVAVQYPACSKQETINLLYSVAESLATLPKGTFNTVGRAINAAIVGVLANAITYLEASAGTEQ